MKLYFRKTITWLLGIALASAIISDSIYGKVEFAKEYLIGQFIGQIFSMSIAFAVVLSLFWFMFEVFLKDFFQTMFYHRDIQRIRKPKDYAKQKTKQQRKKDE